MNVLIVFVNAGVLFEVTFFVRILLNDPKILFKGNLAFKVDVYGNTYFA